jgi:hypothetical protein
MCEKAETSGVTARSKLSYQQFGQSIREELLKEDSITAEEEKMILDDCNLKHG